MGWSYYEELWKNFNSFTANDPEGLMALENTQLDCPFCGGKDKVEGKSIFEGSIYMKNRLGDYTPHEVTNVICTTCGFILNSMVQKKTLCSCELCQNRSLAKSIL